MEQGIAVRKVVVAACATIAASAAISQPAAPAMTAEQWQGVAAADLNAVRDVIQSTHPGAIDDQNPEFQRWTKIGYEQARALIPASPITIP